MEIIDNCPRTCFYCKHGSYSVLDRGYTCRKGLVAEVQRWDQPIECESFDPRISTAILIFGVAEYNLVTRTFATPWVDYTNQRMICTVCHGDDWCIFTSVEVYRRCGTESNFLNRHTIIGEFVDAYDLVNYWDGDNVFCLRPIPSPPEVAVDWIKEGF